MELAPMRYKDYTWPHNPRVYSIEFRRKMGVHEVPYGRYHLQDLGLKRRVMRGEGEFVGPEAYREFKRLAAVFYDQGPGVLVHPIWQTTSAYFVELSLAQEPRRDYVRYTFTFYEDVDYYKAALTERKAGTAEGGASSAHAGQAGSGAVFHRVVRGETLWGIARDYGIALEGLIGLNPGIKNPNLIYPGQEVRVR